MANTYTQIYVHLDFFLFNHGVMLSKNQFVMMLNNTLQK